MNRKDRIEAALRQAFSPSLLHIADDSARHAGHAGASANGETHYSVEVTADAFKGQSRVARSRAVHELLAAEFSSGLHALSLKLRAPGE